MRFHLKKQARRGTCTCNSASMVRGSWCEASPGKNARLYQKKPKKPKTKNNLSLFNREHIKKKLKIHLFHFENLVTGHVCPCELPWNCLWRASPCLAEGRNCVIDNHCSVRCNERTGLSQPLCRTSKVVVFSTRGCKTLWSVSSRTLC
jgi:hypothetical protein